MNRSPWRFLGTVAGAGVLVVVLWHVGTGPFVTGLRSLDPLTLVLGAALGLPVTLTGAWRWHLVSRELKVRVDLAPAVASCYRAQFLNVTLPGGILGDVHRGVRHGQQAGDTLAGMRAVAWERLAGQGVQAAVAIVVLLLLPSPVRDAMPAVLGVLALLATLTVVAVRFISPSRPGSLPARVRRVLRDDLRGLLTVRRAWLGIVVASIAALGFHLATYFLAARAVGVTAPSVTLLPVALLIFLAAGLPVNLAGWGPREGVAAWSFAAAGLGAAQGVATAVAYGAIVLVANLPGAAVLLVASTRRRRPRRGASVPVPVPIPEGGAVHG
ncbi:MAG TPA: lysylphosphatidylglycerol synthase transmembrane domain-containing protein [Nocardioides sp.]|nr:lysylphosphatidylglycerol synthase transmembrane domain-containing protein [Nocardioides sp.]